MSKMHLANRISNINERDFWSSKGASDEERDIITVNPDGLPGVFFDGQPLTHRGLLMLDRGRGGKAG